MIVVRSDVLLNTTIDDKKNIQKNIDKKKGIDLCHYDSPELRIPEHMGSKDKGINS
jgi:hypothetical protein